MRLGGKAAFGAAVIWGVPGMLAAQQAAPPPQTPPALPSQSDISRARVGLPPPETPGFDLRIQAPEKSAVPKAVDSIDFHLSRIVVEGATAYPHGEAEAYFAKLVGAPTDLEAVRNAAAALEAHYHAEGYFLTRVFVPPQRVVDGTLTVRVVEGYLDAVQVEGMDAGSRRAVHAILAPLIGKTPLDLPAVERRLLILNDLPGISASGVLKPGGTFGASTLVVTLVRPRNGYQASVSNTNSRLLGPWVYALNANLNRPIGIPGALSLGVSASGPGFALSQSGSARYSVKLGNRGLIASVGVIVARAEPGASLAPLDIRNDLLSVSARMRYPLIRSRAQSLFLEAGLSVNRSTTDILGQQLVNDHTTDGDIALLYQQNGWLNGSTSVTLDLYHGLPIFGASPADTPLPSVKDFNPDFARLTYAVQRLQRLPHRFSALIAVQGQYANSKLLTGELVAFGGPAIGRGYDPSTITGDRGFGGLGEIRYDLPVGKPWLASAQPYAFLDGAQATSLASQGVPETVQSLRSGGIGVRLYERFGTIDLQGAKAFRRFPGADERPDPRVLVTLTLFH
ncbi:MULTISPECIES: POTRA domain-containing protein [unclassified Sphingomonas]|uniref:ShlB/FhaC/HecB family hemolysin secretion/activation protein n=1 Tax=unclassified Sphingomonas TaxID=196159 RepID=UPI00226A5ACF|nr:MULTISPECIES: POTRA domain-containing protein [unclassified Sphingomonas]